MSLRDEAEGLLVGVEDEITNIIEWLGTTSDLPITVLTPKVDRLFYLIQYRMQAECAVQTARSAVKALKTSYACYYHLRTHIYGGFSDTTLHPTKVSDDSMEITSNETADLVQLLDDTDDTYNEPGNGSDQESLKFDDVDEYSSGRRRSSPKRKFDQMVTELDALVLAQISHQRPSPDDPQAKRSRLHDTVNHEEEMRFVNPCAFGETPGNSWTAQQHTGTFDHPFPLASHA